MSGGDGNDQGNTGPGHNGGSAGGDINGSSDGGTPGGGGWHWDHSKPDTTVGPDGQIHINFEGTSDQPSPGGGGNGGNSSIDPANPNYSSMGLSVSHGQPGYWGYRLITSDEDTNYYLKIFVPYGDSLASQAAKASQDLLDAKQAEEAAKQAAENASEGDKAAAEQAAKEAEEARQNAELEQQKQQRLAAAAIVFSQDIQAVRGIAVVSAKMASPVSFSLAGLGGMAFADAPASAIASRIPSGAAIPVLVAITTWCFLKMMNPSFRLIIRGDWCALSSGMSLLLAPLSRERGLWTSFMLPTRASRTSTCLFRTSAGGVATSTGIIQNWRD